MVTRSAREARTRLLSENDVDPERAHPHGIAHPSVMFSLQQTAEGVRELRGHGVGEEQPGPPASLPEEPTQPQE